ncbi:hypothetical protein GCM10022198_23730 [Klugiella xanthotipulae]|uniref:Uncharacterized protein n=1 Tax=Klugiella xanthotipulae TaxID=244735 RepID=A0A543I6R3_9MICO|nr:hypothetical protein [Klugiella xanthotipulae]TQM66180.1 hypothetical protein FB466_1010 [Klugiella xanthotipulae]
MSQIWTSDTVSALRQTVACPRCAAYLRQPGWCTQCGADLGGAPGVALHEASLAAAAAIERRQELINRLPAHVTATAGQQAGAQPLPTSQFPRGRLPHTSPANTPARSISLQSVLAVAGASLVAVAAFVFTFLNPELTNFATRTTIVAVITAVFLGSAWLMTRAKLQFSAEAIGGLGMVFVALDIWAFSTLAAPAMSAWVLDGIGVLVSSAALVALGYIIRLRTWVWTGFLGFLSTPALFSVAGSENSSAFWLLAVFAAGLALHQLANRLGPRFDSRLRAERSTATVVHIIATLYVLLRITLFTHFDSNAQHILYNAAVLAILAILTALAARTQLRRMWMFASAAAGVTAVMMLPLLMDRLSLYWPALVPAAGALALTLLAATPLPGWMTRPVTLVGGWSVLLAIALWPLVIVLENIGRRGADTRLLDGLTGALGVAAAAAGTAALWALARRQADTARLAHTALIVGLWVAMTALGSVTAWAGLPPVAQAIIGLTAAVTLSLIVTRWPRVLRASGSVRAPIIVAAHLLILLVVSLATVETWLVVPSGIAALAALYAVARTLPRPERTTHLVVGYSYALSLFAYGMSRLGLESIAVLCLTTAVALLTALAATLLPRVRAASWWAILAVTAAPFLIGIASVIAVRSGWTALSTAVACALAVTLLLSQRPGLTLFVRGLAASLIVPSLAVVVVCLGAQVLTGSASPVILPVIAVIVAVALPLTGRIQSALSAHGIAEGEARAARLALEISALVTAAIAVLLALARTAAGLGTTFIVFIVLGLGAAATGLFAHRRYAWGVTGVSFTGALWSLLALSNVTLVEPYVLPPTLAAAVIAAILVARGASGLGIPSRTLYTLGLTIAPLPSLGFLAFWGAEADGSGTWRAPTLLATSVVLIVLAMLLPHFTSRLAPLQRPTLGVAALTSTAGMIQSLRLGWGLDPLAVDPPLIMGLALGFSIIAAALAAGASRIAAGLPPEHTIRRPRSLSEASTPTAALAVPHNAATTGLTLTSRFLGSRWLYAPALLLLTLGPIAAIRPGWFPIWTLWTLASALLCLMIVTAARARTRPVSLPPVWFTFVLAWVTAVAGWSERELRVETFSLPLGLALLTVGIIGLAQTDTARASRGTLTSWPIGFTGSWPLLTPGLLVTLIPSMLATGTDPLTWRAILVLALALVAIFVGSLRRLGAPFIIGLIVLPLENVIVFAVQIGRSIGATPWWITLATVGAVLLVLAVTSERRTEGTNGAAARMRDLT